MSDKELKPCPFCGGKVKLDEYGFYMFGCDDCGAGITFKTENRTFCLSDIGTKVFLTQAEAEQALAERQKNENIQNT